MTWAFAALGLPPDADARAIKRAYAARLKTVRPDEDPQGFQRLNEAYRAALAECVVPDAMSQPLQSDPSSFDPATGLPVLDTAADDASPPVRDDAPADACVMPPSAFPPPLPPVRRWIQGLAPDALAANGPDAAAAFDMDAFFRELHARAGREPVAAFRAWLLGHEALYAMALKEALAVPLVRFLADVPTIRREYLDVVLRFFGLDTVNPRTQGLEVTLERLRERASLDWKRSMLRSADGAPLHPASARMRMGGILLWSLLVGLYALICIAHLVRDS